MRIIIDTSADRRTDVEVTDDVAELEGADSMAEAVAGFRDREYQVSCPVCRSRFAFRTSDPEVTVIDARTASVLCPVDQTPIEFDPYSVEGLVASLNALALSNLAGTAAGGFSGTLSGQQEGSTLTIGAGTEPGFTVNSATGVVSAAGGSQTAGVKTVNIDETLAGATGSPRTSSFAITIT